MSHTFRWEGINIERGAKYKRLNLQTSAKKFFFQFMLLSLESLITMPNKMPKMTINFLSIRLIPNELTEFQ